MAANKENNSVDDASGSEEPGVAELLRSLMAKMDAQAEKMDTQAQAEKMDAQVWEFREAVQKGLGVVRNEARQSRRNSVAVSRLSYCMRCVTSAQRRRRWRK